MVNAYGYGGRTLAWMLEIVYIYDIFSHEFSQFLTHSSSIFSSLTREPHFEAQVTKEGPCSAKYLKCGAT
jgi:hypothetical protein